MEQSLETLCAEVLNQLSASGYTEKGVQKHAATYKLLVAYALEKQVTQYSEQLGKQFIAERYGVVWETKRGNNTEQVTQRIVHLEKLWHLQHHGTIIFSARSGKKRPFICPQKYMREYEAFSVYCIKNDYAQASRHTILYAVQKFLLFLDARKICPLECISALDVESFFTVYADCGTQHLKGLASRVKVFLRFFHSIRFFSINLSITLL